MSILGKSKTKNTEVNSEQEARHISYKVYLNEEGEAEKTKIREKISEYEIKYNEKLEEYLSREDVKEARKQCLARKQTFNINEPTIVNIFKIVEALKKQLDDVGLKYPLDLELNLLANKIDMADYYNKAVDIIKSVMTSIETLAPDIDKSIDLFGKNCGYIPEPVKVILINVTSLLRTYYSGENYLNKIDKEELIKNFNDKKVVVDKLRKEKENDENLKKQLDELIANDKKKDI